MGIDRKVVITRCPVGNASEIIIQNGWLKSSYERQGVDFALLQTLDYKHWDKHFTQEAPLTFREGGNIPPLWAQSSGNRTKVISLVSLPVSQTIIVREDSDIRSIGDLKGRKISLPQHRAAKIDFWLATATRGWETILSSFNLTLEDVEIVKLVIEDNNFFKKDTIIQNNLLLNDNNTPEAFQKEELDALKEGRVDAVYVDGGKARVHQAKGFARIIFDTLGHPELDQTTNLHPNIATVREDFAEEHPDLVVSFLVEMIKAAAWAKTHKLEAAEIFAQGAHVDTASFLDSRAGDFHERLFPGFDEKSIQGLESQKNFLLKHGFIEKDFDVRAWLEPKYLADAAAIVKENRRVLA